MPCISSPLQKKIASESATARWEKWRADHPNRKCANRACGAPVNLTTGHQDHDHDDETVRGVLCQKCNQALGMLHDDVSVVEGLAEYRKLFS